MSIVPAMSKRSLTNAVLPIEYDRDVVSDERPLESKPLSKQQLGALSLSTVGHYEDRARQFWEGTRDHDVSQNIDALLRHLEGAAPFRILDFGCGPGRDLIAFKRAGHDPVGLDAAPSFCEMAAKCGSRTCSNSPCPQTSSTESSRTPRCSTSRLKRCRA